MANEGTEIVIEKSSNPLVFISHDTRDAELAEAFSNLLKSVSAGVLKSFRTSDRKGNQGIEYGIEWYPEIIKNIQCASDVVCLLTKRSVDRPWLLFEAGMAKGKLDTPILGIALGLELKDVSTGPFAQFQNCSDDEDSLVKLVFQLVNRIPNSEPDGETIKFQVGKFKANVISILKKIDDTPKPVQTKKEQNVSDMENSSVKIFEEIKIMFQELPSRIEKTSYFENKFRSRRINPRIIDELIHMTDDDRTRVRICLSFYKEKFPWIYDEGTYLLNGISEKKQESNINRTLEKFERLLLGNKALMLMEKHSINNEDDFYIYKELPMTIMKSLERMLTEIKQNKLPI